MNVFFGSACSGLTSISLYQSQISGPLLTPFQIYNVQHFTRIAGQFIQKKRSSLALLLLSGKRIIKGLPHREALTFYRYFITVI